MIPMRSYNCSNGMDACPIRLVSPGFIGIHHGPVTRYVKLRFAHAPGMPGTFSPPLTSKETLGSDPGMHHGTCVTHVPWCMSGSPTRGGGESVPDIPGACATRNFAYLARGPWGLLRWSHEMGSNDAPGNHEIFWLLSRILWYHTKH